MEVNVEMRTCQVTERLTEDAMSARLHQADSYFSQLM